VGKFVTPMGNLRVLQKKCIFQDPSPVFRNESGDR
jgi:hypothetical protein